MSKLDRWLLVIAIFALFFRVVVLPTESLIVHMILYGIMGGCLGVFLRNE